MQIQFTLKQLEYFVAAAESGTLRSAAERCHVSQVGLGIALTELERSLGVQLLIRRRAKGVALTPEGRSILVAARTVIAHASELQSTVNSTMDEVSGTLRVGCHTGFSLMLMPDICDTFASQHPDLDIKFREDSQEHLQSALEDGELEVAFLYERGLPETLDWIRVIEMKPYILVSADHPLANRKTVSLTDFADEPLVRLSIPPNLESVVGWGTTQGPPSDGYTASSVELVRTLVGRGVGYALLGQRFESTLTNEGRKVQALQISEDIPPVRVVLAFARGLLLPRRSRALAEFVRDRHG